MSENEDKCTCGYKAPEVEKVIWNIHLEKTLVDSVEAAQELLEKIGFPRPSKTELVKGTLNMWLLNMYKMIQDVTPKED